MEKVPISVVVIAKNEENNIEDCLKSMLWADEIVVLDDHSSDRTVELARKYTNSIFSRKMDVEGIHRNYAYGLAKNNWVLSIDADERVSPELADELRQIFKNPIKDIVFAIPIKTYLGKKWIRYGGWYPASKVRLLDKRTVRYEEKGVHPRIIYHGSCGHLKGDIIHYSYRNFHDFFETLNKQTTAEAKKWYEEKRKVGALKAFRKFLSRFLRYYVVEQGFRDGLIGFMAAWGGGFYQIMTYVKLWEMLQVHSSELIVDSKKRGEMMEAVLSVVMPVYNEKATVLKIIDKVLRLDIVKEIVVVDDCSTDGTRELLKHTKLDGRVKLLFHDVNMGKGAALRTGFRNISGEVAVIQDADLEYDPNEFIEMIKPINEGVADVVYGSRLTGGKPQRVHLFWHRVGNDFLTFLTNLLYNTTLSDMETCYKMFRKDVIDKVAIKSDDFSVEPELTAKILKNKSLRVYEMPISYYGRNYAEGKKINWTHGLGALWALLKYRITD